MEASLPATTDLYRSTGRMMVRFFGRTPGAACLLASHAILGCSGLDSVFLNCGVIFGSAPAGDDPAEARLREFVARIRLRGAGGYVCLSESVQAELEPLARRLGLEPLSRIPLMARLAPPSVSSPEMPGGEGPVPVPPPPADSARRRASIERVTSEVGIAELLAVSEAAFDLPIDLYGCVVTPSLLDDPALAIYLYRLGGAAVSCMCVVDDDGIAGISGMATLPELQRRGIGGRLLDHVLASHAERTRAFVLTASEEGEPFYRRHGFAVVDRATAWVVPPPER